MNFELLGKRITTALPTKLIVCSNAGCTTSPYEYLIKERAEMYAKIQELINWYEKLKENNNGFKVPESEGNAGGPNLHSDLSKFKIINKESPRTGT